jgi:hypothetical protein
MISPPAKLSRDQHHLLDWLAKEHTSALGECRGRALDMLLQWNLAEIVERDHRGRDYDRVALTPAGRHRLREMGAWKP